MFRTILKQKKKHEKEVEILIDNHADYFQGRLPLSGNLNAKLIFNALNGSEMRNVNKMISKIKENNEYPTKQERQKLCKYFYGYRYLWSKNDLKDDTKYAQGFRKDVKSIFEIKELQKLINFFQKKGYIQEISDIVAINDYLKGIFF